MTYDQIVLLGGLLFLPQLAVGEGLFAAHFRRRSRFALRAVLCAAGELALGAVIFLVISRTHGWLMQSFGYYLLLFLVSLPGLFLCYREEVWVLLSCAVTGYIAQHMASELFQILFRARWESDLDMNLAAGGIYFLGEVALFAAVYLIVWALFARRFKNSLNSGTVAKQILLLSAAALLIILLLSSFRDSLITQSLALANVTWIFSVICCILLLVMRSSIFWMGEMEQERQMLQQIGRMEQEQFELQKENMEIINVKCHDLKRRLAQARNQSLTGQEMAEMEEAVAIYDSSIRTGNETLDALLSQWSLCCVQRGIRLSCMADGSRLEKMSVGDICALFGNALENAIEAVSLLEHEEDRVISFTLRPSRGMLAVTLENGYEGEKTFEDGLPVTTKGDSRSHGYGLKSIRMVVQKYGGAMTVLADDHLFRLNVLLPL